MIFLLLFSPKKMVCSHHLLQIKIIYSRDMKTWLCLSLDLLVGDKLSVVFVCLQERLVCANGDKAIFIQQ